MDPRVSVQQGHEGGEVSDPLGDERPFVWPPEVERERGATGDERQSGIRTFGSGATRDTDEGKLDWEGFVSPVAMRFFAEYMHKHRHQSDGTLRDADNWQKGMPRRQYMKSLIRHTWDLWLKWRCPPYNIEGLVDLLCAIIFNAQGLLLEIALGRYVEERQNEDNG